MRSVLVGIGVWLAAALPAHAQIRGTDPNAQLPGPQDIRPFGMQMGMYRGMPAHFEADQCGPQGCIIIVNRTPSHDVAQFYINDGKLDSYGEPVWGANQFQGFSLHSNKAIWTPRPRKMKCAITVRVVLRDRETGGEIESTQPFDLCDMPKAGFAILEIQFGDPNLRGEVRVEGEAQ